MNLTVGGVSLVLPAAFAKKAPSVMGEGGGRGRGRRSIDDAGSGSDCLLAILINYRGNPWRNDDDVPRAQVDTVISSLQVFRCVENNSDSPPIKHALPKGRELEMRIPINERADRQIPKATKFLLLRSRMNVHAFNVTSGNLGHALRVSLRLDPLPVSSRVAAKRHFPLALLIGRGEPPTPSKYLKKEVFDRGSETLDLFLDSLFNETGIHYVAVVDATFDAGRRRQDDIRQRRYRVEMWWSRCLEWTENSGRGRSGDRGGDGGAQWEDDAENGEWTKGGCETLNSSTIRSAHCRCRHPSSIFAATSLPIPVSEHLLTLEVDGFFPTSNHVVPTALSMLLFLFLLLFAFAWRADVTDDVKTQVIYLPDNDPAHAQAYQLTVETGFRRGAGTTSRVSVVLHGQDGMSETRELVAFHPDAAAAAASRGGGGGGGLGGGGCGSGAKTYQRMVLQSTRQLFARNSRDMFVITVPKSLGPIWKVQVWHDNSGPSPSWFLSRILVKDLSTRSCAIFVADKWFAVEEDDGKVEREILAADVPLPTNVIFKAKVCQYLTDFHLWLSVATRPSYSRFTRCQRCGLCLSLLLGYMTLAAVWCHYREDEYRGELALLDVSWKTVSVGCLTSLLLFPINLPLSLFLEEAK